MLLVVSNAAHDSHDAGRGHPERTGRTRVARDGLLDAGLHDAMLDLEARPATRAEIERVHDDEYLIDLELRCASGGGSLDPDTNFGPGSWDTARRAAGAGLQAVEALDTGAAEAAFVLTRPPGHHALPRRGMGFCLFNNIAITAAALAERGERVLVVDWDVHHGNGTQAAFWNDPRVLFVSTHQRGLFPSNGGFVEEVGGPAALGSTLNLPLPAGATGDVVRAALDEVAAPEIEAFSPTWVLVSAGFDAHRADPLADMDLQAGDFADLAASSSAWAPQPGRLILFLEGGYDFGALAASTGAAAAAVLGTRFRPEPATTGGPGRELIPLLARRRRQALEASVS